jgi:hypothetical protein
MPKQFSTKLPSAELFLVVSSFFWQHLLQTPQKNFVLSLTDNTVAIKRQRSTKPGFKELIAMFVYVFKSPAVSRANNIREIHAGKVRAFATNFPAVPNCSKFPYF